MQSKHGRAHERSAFPGRVWALFWRHCLIRWTTTSLTPPSERRTPKMQRDVSHLRDATREGGSSWLRPFL